MGEALGEEEEAEVSMYNIIFLNYLFIACWSVRLSVSVCSRRHMIVPEREALFAALANNLDIINQQKQRLEKLESDLHKLRLYRGTPVWSFPSQTPTTPSGQR